MKISIISASNSASSSKQAVDSIVNAARRQQIIAEVSYLTTLDNLAEWVDTLGDVVVFRRADAVKNATQRTRVFKEIKSQRILINDIIIQHPQLRWKDWQQNFVAQSTSVQTIPTWTFNSVQEWRQAVAQQQLPWPLIQKPRGGIGGRDVHLLQTPTDLVDSANLSRYVWQPFIPNDGDYRVLVVGGSVIGSMHRRAAEGRITNNIGQGGTGTVVTDSVLASKLAKISLDIQQALPLDIVGIDIIQSLSDQQFYFLELNISPAWAEFEAVTKISVGDAVINMSKRRYQESLTQ